MKKSASVASGSQRGGSTLSAWAGLLLLATGCLSGNTFAQDLPYYQSSDFTPHWLVSGDPAIKNFHRIPAFQLTNQDGQSISERTVQGKIYVASFFFSTCPGICPAIRSKLAKVQSAFQEDDTVMILSHSIRPTTDTPEVLKDYAKRNSVRSGKWHLLTGDQGSIYALARDAYFANEDLGNITNLNDFLHTENLLLIDKERHIRGVYNGLSSSSVANLIADIQTLSN